MRTENGFSRAGKRARRRFVLAVLTTVCLAALVAPASGQQDGEPPWRDLDEATRQLRELEAQVEDARRFQRQAELRLDQLRAGIDDTDVATLDAATQLQQVQDRARRLAVEAYIAGGPIADSLYVLDAPTANDYAYRSVLATESADAVARSQVDWQQAQLSASDEALELAAEIDRLQREIVLADVDVAIAEAAIPDAEWVIEIALIHAAADEQMERWGRIEPTAEDWDNLRFCESTRNYQINTGNGYFGAYQFNVQTWVDMGGSGMPHEASPEEQDARARYLYALRGSGYNRGGAWPVCGRFLPSG